MANFLYSSEMAVVNFATSWRATTSLECQEVSSNVRVLLVAVRDTTEARSLGVAVARLAMSSTVS